MLGFATIRKDGFPKQWLDRQRWSSLIGEFPELRRIESIKIGSQHYPAPDSAELIEDGKVVGLFIWENGQIYVDGPYSMFPLAKGIADILDAGVFDKTGDEILEQPEEVPRPTGDRPAHHHQYPEAVDLSGKDLISCFGRTKSEIAGLVGAMLDKSQMSAIRLPVDSLMNMTGEIADEVHEWPHATQGAVVRHLVLQFLHDRLIGMRWTFQEPAPAALVERKPWWRFW